MAKRNNLSKLLLVAGVVVFLSAVLFISNEARAASDFNMVTTATATSTTNFLTPGTGTTTLVYLSRSTATDHAVLLTQMTASSTSTVLNIAVDYSHENNLVDCSVNPTACDWYADNLNQSLNSTTTPVKSLNTPNSYTWTAAGTARTGKAIDVPTPTRYVRVTYTVSGANASIWGAIVTQKPQPE